MPYFLAGKRLTIRPQNLLGSGGEADVYKVGNKAVKIYKNVDHTDFANDPNLQAQAKLHLQILQTKLPRYPNLKVDRVVKPLELVRDASKQIAGYSMAIVSGAEPLLRLSNRGYRDQFVAGDTVTNLFRDIHSTVGALHQAGVVIGDFNDCNVLILGDKAYFIDTDSYQYGGFASVMFTTRFVDPRICKVVNGQIVLSEHHDETTDWYAYAALLLQSLVCVDPFGGVYRPKNKADKLTPTERLLNRVTVFHPDVKYPKPALPLSVLPDELLSYFDTTFTSDNRGIFPISLLDNVRFTKCKTCGLEHARAICPGCSSRNAAAVKATVRGNVTQEFILRTSGRVLRAEYQNGELYYLYYQNGEFRREDGEVVFTGSPAKNTRYCVIGSKTAVAGGQSLLVFKPGELPERYGVDNYQNIPMVASNDTNLFWVSGGSLFRDGYFGPERIGDVLQNQTLFWVGNSFGLGFYRAGNIARAFVFDAKAKTINDSVALPPYSGSLVDADCAFSSEYAWLFLQTRQKGKLITTTQVYKNQGVVVASGNSTQLGNEWMEHIHGHTATGDQLFVATDDGIVRVSFDSNQIFVTSEFSDTEPYVTSHTRLVLGQGGIYLVEAKDLTHVTLKTP